MIHEMGLDAHLCGVTFECPPLARACNPVVLTCPPINSLMDSQQIDEAVSAAAATGTSLYRVDVAALKAANPDIVFTQDLCSVCQIDPQTAQAALASLSKPPLVVSLTPHNLGEVFDCARTIARVLNAEDHAEVHLGALNARLARITECLRSGWVSPRRVVFLEWLSPLFCCGHWIPEQIQLAGGIDAFGVPGEKSRVIEWEDLRASDPEVILIGPCGFDVCRTQREMPLLTARPGWHDLTAVRNNEVHVIEANLFTQPAAGTLVEGIELLAGLLHPGVIGPEAGPSVAKPGQSGQGTP